MVHIVVIGTRNGVTQMTTETRIAEWIASSHKAATMTLSASQAFEQAIRDMRHAGYRLPAAVVPGVRAGLEADVITEIDPLDDPSWVGSKHHY
jgi:hypothetical protein